jgi:cytochrome b pre-mRNA-processing protein 3
MIFRIFQRPLAPTIDALYGGIVAQARLPVFYAGFGVPDTVDGRFDLVVLHLVLVLGRLRLAAAGQAPSDRLARDLGQGLFDTFCRDMDNNLREMGVGDLSVPKQMKRLGEAFYGRQQAYDAALANDDAAALTAAIARNVYSGETGPQAPRLAAYMRASAAKIATIDLIAAPETLAFADPVAILGDGAISPKDDTQDNKTPDEERSL